MKFKYISLIGFILFSIACNPSREITISKEDNITQKNNRHDFLKGAVEYGMIRDGFPKDLIRPLIDNNDNWVTKCPICRAVSAGMESYLKANHNISKQKFKSELRNSLMSDDQKIRFKTLNNLIDRYVQQHFDFLKMTDKEQTEMKEKLVEGRKSGMGLVSNPKPDFFCPSCDGACHMPKD